MARLLRAARSLYDWLITLEDLQLLRDIAIALGLAFGGGFAARLAGLSPIVGYLLAGVAISPFTPGYDADLATIRQIAELGVVFLMFGVGLHFNLRDLNAVKGIAIPGAVIQMSAATGMGLGISLLFGLDWREGLVLGLAMSVASTVVLVRALEDRGLMASMHGRVAIGWLIVEDLATVLFLVLLPVLERGGDNGVARELALALAKASVFLVVMLVFGARLVPWLLGLVARTGSRELFILAVVAGALGIATGAAFFGLSIALGAFIAGVVISETELSHQAAADVLPLREAFAVLFFVSVGMLLDPDMVRENLGLLAAVIAAIIIGKSLIAMVVAAAFPYPARTGLTVAAGLAQVGEFSFIIAQEGLDLELIGSGAYNVILAASVVSITLNPLAFRLLVPGERFLRETGPLWRLLDRQGPPPAMHAPVSDHVIVAGYGRVGELTGHALGQMQIPFVVIESNLELARRLATARINTVWGDAASSEVLRMANAEGAKLLVISVPDESTTMLTMVNARKLSPELPIIVRARDGAEVTMLMSMGAQEVVVPEYEGGLELMRQTLVALGFDAEEALHYSHAVRDIHYGDEGPHP